MLLLVSLVGCGGTQDTPPTETPPTQEEETPAVSVTKSSIRMDWGDHYVFSVSGRATNNTDTYVSNVVVTFTLYDDVDVPMKKSNITVGGLGANETKEFDFSYEVDKSIGRVPQRVEITEVKYN